MSDCLLSCLSLCVTHVWFAEKGETRVHNAETSALRPLTQTPAGENHLDKHVFLDIKYWRQLDSSLCLHQCHHSPSLPATCSLFFSHPLCCQEAKNTRLSLRWGDCLTQQEQRAASCLYCVTPPRLLLFLPPLFIIFPLSYICLRQLPWEVFVTKKPTSSLSVFTLWLGLRHQYQQISFFSFYFLYFWWVKTGQSD